MRYIFPVYIPIIWHVHDMTVSGGSRTNNMCEAWNRSFSALVGHAHPTIWTLVEALCKDFSSVQGTKRFNQLVQPPWNHAHHPATSTTKEPCALSRKSGRCQGGGQITWEANVRGESSVLGANVQGGGK